MYFDHIHMDISQIYHFPPQSTLLSVFLSSYLCCPHTSEYLGIYWRRVEQWGDLSVKKTDSPFSSKYKLSVEPQVGVELVAQFLPLNWDFVSLEIVQFIACTHNTVSSYAWTPCCSLKILWPCSHALPLTFTVVLPSMIPELFSRRGSISLLLSLISIKIVCDQ